MRDRREKFVELATKRTNKALEQMRLIGNLANRSNYEFTEEDARKIVRALQKELDGIKGRFAEASGGRRDGEFRL